MANLEVTLSLGSNQRLYEINMTDDGPDGGNLTSVSAHVNVNGTIGFAEVEAALQTFAATLTAPEGYTLQSIKSTSSSQTTL